MREIRFQHITATAPDPSQLVEEYAKVCAAYDGAKDATERANAIAAWDTLRRDVQTWQSLVGLEFSQDTQDAERKAALDFRNELAPKIQEQDLAFIRRVVSSDHVDEVSSKYGRQLLDLWSCQADSFDPAIEQELIAEAKVGSEYMELMSSARFEYRGETLTHSELSKYREHSDRAVRYETGAMSMGWFNDNATQLDALYDRLVTLRATQAKELGYKSFVELGYKKMSRIDYSQDDVARYREAVKNFVVPLCAEIREQQRKALGVDRLMTWDLPVHDPAGNPKPIGDHDFMVEQARVMFDEMGGGLGTFFRIMSDGELLDLKSRKGKAGGGFCTSFPKYGVPFIFANFNGTKGDVEVFTHEMGHAFQCWSSSDDRLMDTIWPTYEAAEVHSMSLEFLTWPHMEKFFGDDAERFRKLHLTQSLLFLPYGVAVDHFQHLVYSRPDATPTERLSMWKEMEATYLPDWDHGDLSRAQAGGAWQRQRHIYLMPFYYIDYTLAQVCALQFLKLSRDDADDAMARYVNLCKRGGEAPFQELVRSAGLRSPFDEGCLEDVVTTARAALRG